MIDKRTLLPPLVVLGGLACGLPMWGQYSSPIRDVSDPGRAPFQVLTAMTLASGDNTPLAVTSLPVGASQRLVVDLPNIRVQGTDSLPSFVVINVSAGGSVPGIQIFFPLVPMALPPNVQQISIGLQPIRLYVSAGQPLSVVTLNLSPNGQSVFASFTGHYVSLP